MAVGAVNIAIGANIGGFTAAMRDASSSVAQFTGAFKEQFGGLKKTADAPRGAFAELNRTLQITKAQIRDVVAVGGKVPAELTAKYALLQRSVAGVNDAFKETPTRLQLITRTGQNLQSVGENLTKFVTLPILAIGAAAFRTYAQLDALQRGLANIEGSAAGAEARFATLREVAKLPGLGLEEAVQGDVRLRAVGFSAEQSRQALLQFGNALALTGGGKFELNSVLTQLTQMGSKAKVLAEDLKPILTASPAVAKAIKEMFGTVDSEQISAQLKATGRGPREFIDDLVKKLATLERVSGGPKNAIENFGDSLKIAGFEIGRAADRSFGLTAALDGLGSLIGGAVGRFGELSPTLQTVTLSVVGLAAALGPLTVGVGSLIAAGPALTSLLATAKVGFAAITGPIGLAVVGITALGVALFQAQKPLFDWVDKTRLIADVTKTATASVATEKATVERLLSTARNEQISKTARIKAIQQLNALSPQYLGNLSLENINSDKAAEAVRKHADAINVRAQARAAEDKLVELYRKRDETAGRDLSEFTRPINGRTQFDPQSGISLTGLTKEQLDAKARKEKADAIATIDQNINDIQSFIRGAARRATRRGVDLGGTGGTPFDYSGVAGKNKKAAKEAALAYKEPISQLQFWQKTAERLRQTIAEIEIADGVASEQDLKDLGTALDKIQQIEQALKRLDAYKTRGQGADPAKPITSLISSLSNGGVGVDELPTPTTNIASTDRISSLNNSIAEKIRAIQKETEEAAEEFKAFNERTGLQLADSGVNLLSGLGESLAVGAGPIKSALKSILDILANYMIQIGSALLLQGVISGAAAIVPTPLSGFLAANGINSKLAGGTLIAGGGLIRGLGAKAFANGGVVYGPTLGLVGEYAGARSNPEVIAPLNKLKTLIEPTTNEAQVFIPNLTIRGADMLVAFERAQKQKNYRG